MKKNKRIYYIYITILTLLVFIFPSFVSAQIIISEIMYDVEGSDTGREWIEIKNTGVSSVDLSDWRFNDGSNHVLLISEEKGGQGSLVVGAGEYAILASDAIQFLSEYSGFNGIVIDTVMSLGQQDDRTYMLSLIHLDGTVENTASYTIAFGALGDGNSLQLISESWMAGSPTPGAQNDPQDIVEVEEENNNSVNQSENQPAPSDGGSSFPIEPQIFAYAGEDKSVPVGADTVFEGKSFGLKKEPLLNARYMWNFGNLEIKEGQNVLHYYKYPGEYVVVLNVSSGEFSASDRIIVNAYPAELDISNVDTDFIEIHNKSNRELNLSWWQIQSGNSRFIIPKDTIILPNKRLIFSSDITKLDTKNKKDISFLYPNGTLAIKFEEIKVLQKNPSAGGEDKKVNTQKQTPQKTELNIPKDSPWEKDTVQTASVVSSISTDKKDKQIYKWLFILFGIIAVSVGIIIYVSDKKEPGDDIEIIE